MGEMGRKYSTGGSPRAQHILSKHKIFGQGKKYSVKVQNIQSRYKIFSQGTKYVSHCYEILSCPSKFLAKLRTCTLHRCSTSDSWCRHQVGATPWARHALLSHERPILAPLLQRASHILSHILSDSSKILDVLRPLEL